MNLDLSLTPYTKTNLKWVTDLRAKYMTFRKKKNIGENIWDQGFLYLTSETQTIKEKEIEKLDSLRLRYFAMKML